MSTERPSGARSTRDLAFLGSWLDAFRNRGFVACVVVLVSFAVGFEVLAVRWGIQFRKLPVPLKKPLGELRQERIAPYKLVHPMTLQPDILNQLGTEEYVQWLVAAPSETPDDASGPLISLFVTYYTGKPDPVPHTPEACYAGSGHRLLRQSPDTVTISGVGGDRSVPIQVLEFQRQGLLGNSERIVAYTFHANGQFQRDRQAVRYAVGAPSCKYAYFSKVEVAVDIGSHYASKDRAVEAAKRFLTVILPVLLQDHWPNWDAVVHGGEAQPGNGTVLAPGGGGS